MIAKGWSGEFDFESLNAALRGLSGVYEQAARAAASVKGSASGT